MFMRGLSAAAGLSGAAQAREQPRERTRRRPIKAAIDAGGSKMALERPQDRHGLCVEDTGSRHAITVGREPSLDFGHGGSSVTRVEPKIRGVDRFGRDPMTDAG